MRGKNSEPIVRGANNELWKSHVHTECANKNASFQLGAVKLPTC